MDKQIITTLLIIAAVVCFGVAFNAVYPAVLSGSDALVSLGRATGDRLKTDITILHAAGELDADGMWQDTNGDGDLNVFVWVKNTGSLRITAVQSGDLFLGPEGDFARIPHESEAEGAYPYWAFEIENGTEWNPTRTVKISVHYNTTLSSQRYYLKVSTPNGCVAETFFSM